MQTVLSTKMLSQAQKNLLLNAGIGVVEYNAIKIEIINFSCDEITQNGIITSRNSAEIIIEQNLRIENVFCVGEKTATLLRENGYHIVEAANYGKELAELISTGYKEREYIFFCGNKRREDIPLILKEKNIPVQEIEIYKTHLIPKSFEQEFDGILFFSPSAVQSFMIKNASIKCPAFCIGTTTAAEVKNYTEEIIIASCPSINNVIVQVVKNLKYD